MKVLKIQETNGRGKVIKTAQVLFNGKKYLISDNGYETLVFPYDEKGEVVYLEVGGGRGVTLADVLHSFEETVSPFLS